MAKLANKEIFNELKETGDLTIVDFYAPWCGPCQMFLPVFDEYSENNPEIKMIKIDIDQEQDLTNDNKVLGVPTIIAYKDGVEVDRFSGFKTIDELTKFINSNK